MFPVGVGVEVSTRGMGWSARGEGDENKRAYSTTLRGVSDLGRWRG